MGDDEYHHILAHAREACRTRGIDRTLHGNDIDVILAPVGGPIFHISGAAGKFARYPLGICSFSYQFHRVSNRYHAIVVSQLQWAPIWASCGSAGSPGGITCSSPKCLGSHIP